MALSIPAPWFSDDPDGREEDLGNLQCTSSPSILDAQLRLPIVLPYRAYPPHISPQTLADLLLNPGSYSIRKTIIVDARTVPEYRTGHIRTAINAQTLDDVKQLFTLYSADESKDVAIILHCEYSSKRGPALAFDFRDYDRKCQGAKQYPNLQFHQVYLLDRGYRAFYRLFPNLCHGGYLKMKAVRGLVVSRSRSQETPPISLAGCPCDDMEGMIKSLGVPRPNCDEFWLSAQPQDETRDAKRLGLLNLD
jgi:hypothetical protein